MRLDRELTCAEVVELVTAYLEQRLPTTDLERFEEHLVFCDGCSTYLDQMRAAIAAAGALRTEDVPAPLKERLLATFRETRSL
jgi:anti-sigma factor RsiW